MERPRRATDQPPCDGSRHHEPGHGPPQRVWTERQRSCPDLQPDPGPQYRPGRDRSAPLHDSMGGCHHRPAARAPTPHPGRPSVPAAWHVLAACSNAAAPASAPPPGRPGVRAAQRRAGPPPAAPAPPVCGDDHGDALRDKLAQLLMVGVRNGGGRPRGGGDNHVGGIFIGSWTDLSMLTDGSLGDIASGGRPAGAGGQRGRRKAAGFAAVGLIGASPSAPGAGPDQDADEVYQIAWTGARPCGLGITIDFAPVVDVSESGRRQVIGDRSFERPRGGHHLCRRLRPRAARRRAAAGAEAFPRPRPRVR